MAVLNLAVAAPDMADDMSGHVRRDNKGEHFEAAVKGAHCANCLGKIERGVGALPGVAAARLNLSTGKLSVGGTKLSPQAILRRVRDLGYEAQPFDAGEILSGGEKQTRLLLRCLAVAGFGTVFAMGLTDSIWYGGVDLSPDTRQLFFWLAGAVAIPATLYAGQPFFRSAWRALKVRQTNMDLPISLALLLALALSLYQTAQHGAHTYFDASVMLVFLLLVGRYLDHRLRDKAQGAARHLLALQSLLVRRLGTGDQVETVAAREIVPGERILLATGDRVPVNGILASASECDMSLVTGESMPLEMAVGVGVPSGAIITGAPAILTATASVENSLVADLARLLEAGQQARSVYVRLADRAARLYVPSVFILSLLALVGWLAAGASPAQAITSAITVLIITCPCALGLAVPAVQIVATSRLFRDGVFVKSGDALERLAEIDMAVFDKTGTLTMGKPVLQHAERLPAEILERAARIARASRHPLAQALALAAGPGPVADHVREVAGFGLERDLNGAVERLGSAAWCGATDAGSAQLWFRWGDTPAVGLHFRDEVRPQAKALIAALVQRGIPVEMLSGDNAATVGAVAAELGIANWFARVTPQQKAARLTALRQQGRKVLMVGDGINDAAAMALAHVSIAPGSATDISQRASDLVLRGDDLGVILEAHDVARRARRLVLQNFTLAAAYNLTAIPMAALGFVTPLIAAGTMAGSSLLVTLNALRLAGKPWR